MTRINRIGYEDRIFLELEEHMSILVYLTWWMMYNNQSSLCLGVVFILNNLEYVNFEKKFSVHSNSREMSSEATKILYFHGHIVVDKGFKRSR